MIKADFDNMKVKGKRTSKAKKKRGKRRDSLASDDSLNDFIVSDDADIEYDKIRRKKWFIINSTVSI